MVLIYNGILAIEKDKLMPFAAILMELQILILSEESQKEKDKYHMMSLICGIYNMEQMILSKKKKKQKQIMAMESRFGVTMGERGMDRHFGCFIGCKCYIWNGWAMGPYCTAEGTVSDWVTLLYNRT